MLRLVCFVCQYLLKTCLLDNCYMFGIRERASSMDQTFSSRNGYLMPVPQITVRDDAPEDIRYHMVAIAIELGLSPLPFRDLVCAVMRKRPDRSNWSEYPNIHQEVENLVESAPWFKVYDIAEKIYEKLEYQDFDRGQKFQRQFSELLVESGVGLQMKDGMVVIRGTEDFGNTIETTLTFLDNAGKKVAANEMREAIRDISRRPNADVSGAVQHAMAALECVARDLTGQNSKTLGQILPDLSMPKPLDEAMQKLWGFASQNGRHLSEVSEPSFEEAALVVSISGAVCSYLLNTFKT
jgi:AbiJ N-terminal domain 4